MAMIGQVILLVKVSKDIKKIKTGENLRSELLQTVGTQEIRSTENEMTRSSSESRPYNVPAVVNVGSRQKLGSAVRAKGVFRSFSVASSSDGSRFLYLDGNRIRVGDLTPYGELKKIIGNTKAIFSAGNEWTMLVNYRMPGIIDEEEEEKRKGPKIAFPKLNAPT